MRMDQASPLAGLGKLSEQATYESCVHLYTAAGCRVKRLSQARATRQTPGIPDLKVFAVRIRQAWWMECKASGGRQSAAQREFQREAQACGEVYLLGGIDEAKAHLVAVGLARYDGSQFILALRREA